MAKQFVEEYYTQDGWSIAQCIEHHKKENPTHTVKHFQMTTDMYQSQHNETKFGAYAVIIYEEEV